MKGFVCLLGSSTLPSVIAKELCDREELAEATHGHPKARRVEYSAETADIRIVCPSRVPTSRKPADSVVENRQGQLNEIQNHRGSSQLAPKCD